MTPIERYYATEYHRRNMQVARVVGANASVNQCLERAKSVKSIPQWVISYLESASERLPGLQYDLAAWRDLADDAPETVKAARISD
jgi:hypothetical protein